MTEIQKLLQTISDLEDYIRRNEDKDVGEFVVKRLESLGVAREFIGTDQPIEDWLITESGEKFYGG